VKVGRSPNDTCAMLSKAYWGEAMQKSGVFEWRKHFKDGHKNVEDGERSGCPRSHRTDENVEKMQNLMHSDRRFKYQQSLLCGNIEADL